MHPLKCGWTERPSELKGIFEEPLHQAALNIDHLPHVNCSSGFNSWTRMFLLPFLLKWRSQRSCFWPCRQLFVCTENKGHFSVLRETLGKMASVSLSLGEGPWSAMMGAKHPDSGASRIGSATCMLCGLGDLILTVQICCVPAKRQHTPSTEHNSPAPGWGRGGCHQMKLSPHSPYFVGLCGAFPIHFSTFLSKTTQYNLIKQNHFWNGFVKIK